MSTALRDNGGLKNNNCTLLYVGKVSDDPYWSFPAHKHDDLHEIIYIADGKGSFTVDGKPYDVHKGDILVLNSGMIHEERTEPEYPLYTYYCGFRFGSEEGNPGHRVIEANNEPFIQANRYSDQIAMLMKMLFEEFSIREEAFETISHNLLNNVLLLIKRMLSTQSKADHDVKHPLAKKIKDFLDFNYRQNLKLTDVAEHFHIDTYYLIHVFKNNYGIPPYSYLINRRMGEATKLLSSTHKKIWEIAKLVGYENPNYFTIIFTKMIGESPRSFREKHNKDLFYE